MPNCVQSTALKIPSLNKLRDKRVILASNSPRRQEILASIGVQPELVSSTFAEDLSPDEFEDIHEYPVSTALHKAVEVYERLVNEDEDNPPDLVIAADTVVLTHAPPAPIGDASDSFFPGIKQELLEKPRDKEDQMRMLLDLNGNICEVVTGVVIAYPILTAPGYKTQAIDERTLVHFADNSEVFLKAYVEHGEGLDRAGGFAIQGHASLLIRKVDGDYNNVVGFPLASFIRLLELCIEDEDDFLEI